MNLFQEKEKRMQLYICYCAFVMNGMLALSIGSLLPYIKEARNLDYVASGLLVSLHSVGNLISSFFAGASALKFGRKRSILAFNALYAIAYLIIILSGNMT